MSWEAQISAHIRSLLLDYVREHITIDHVQFTQAAVAEACSLVSLEQVPDHDPSSLTLPTDPFATLWHIHHLNTLLPYQEKFITTQNALLYIKNTLTLPKTPLKSESISWGRDAFDEYDDSALDRVESILTRRAMRETPVLGTSAGAHQALGMQKVDTRSFSSLMASKPFVFKPIVVEPVLEPQVKFNHVLDVTYYLKAADHAAVRDLLQSVAAVSRVRPTSPNGIERDCRRAYLPPNFAFEPPKSQTPPLDSPPFTPIFPRNERFKRSEDRHSRPVLRSYAELPERIGAVMGRKALEIDECDDLGAVDDLPRATMIVVDGWQTYDVSSPSTVSSFEDDEIDELAEMFPPSPNTSIIVDFENAKLDEIQIPKDRRIGGSLGGSRDLPTIVNDTRKAGGYGAFVTNMLKSPFHNPEDRCQTTAQPSQTPTIQGGDDNIRPSSDARDNELESMCGQASTVSVDGAKEYMIEAEGFREDTDIRDILHPLFLGVEREPGRSLSPNQSGLHHRLMTEDLLFGKDPKEDIAFKLMPVPTLPEPNNGVERNTLRYSDYLAAEVKGHQTVQEKKAVSPLRFLKNTKGMAPLRVALSWVPFTRTSPLPGPGEILQNDLESEDSLKCEVDLLLRKVCLNDEIDSVQKDSEREDERCWRDSGVEIKEPDEFSAEIARCEIIMTRRERMELLAREKGNVNRGHEVEDEIDRRKERKDLNAGTNPEVAKQIEVTKRTSPGHEEKLHDDETGFRPAKRPRLDVDDSGIVLMPQDDYSFYDSNPDDMVYGDDLLDAFTGDNKFNMLMNDIDYEQYEDYSQPIAKNLAEISTANTYEDYEFQSKRGPDHSTTVYTGREPLRSLVDDGDGSASCFQEPDLRIESHRNEPTMLHFDRTNSLGETPNGLLNSKSSVEPTAFKKFSNLDLASYSLGIEAFAKLRAKSITTNVVTQPVDIVSEVGPLECDRTPATSVPRIVPKELYDDKTVQIPPQLPQPSTSHQYMASLGLLQKQVLVRYLAKPCLVELVERESLDGVDLIIDSDTAVIFASLLSLPAHGQKLLDTLSTQSWRYKRVLVVFEAYPESKSFRRPKIQTNGEDLDPFTAPIIKAIKKFRRNINIEEGCGRKAVTCDMWCAFPTSVNEAATCARLFGDAAECVDSTNGKLWGDRQWLDVDVPQQDERDLGSLAGMNCFSASIVLSQMTLQQFLDMTPEQRLAMFDEIIGVEAITILNMDIERRMQIVNDDALDV
ncbi:hypothetical protein H0H92_005776 [Tricholoma furcatifolium]|nr:hypothetical protein H0H92_005776 [Tricholoma furcatifolium]